MIKFGLDIRKWQFSVLRWPALFFLIKTLVKAMLGCWTCVLQHKEKIMHWYDRHNTTMLSIKHNISTTCFGQYYFWPSSGWIKLSEKTTQYIIWYSITISVGVSRGGRDLVYRRVGGRVCAEGIMCRSIYVDLYEIIDVTWHVWIYILNLLHTRPPNLL